MLPGAEVTAQHTFALVGQRIPHGILCLLSALNFHGLTTQNPRQVWIALDYKAWPPQLDTVRLRLCRSSGTALREGVEEHRVEGIPIRIYNPARTVADGFKFRHKVGLDVAFEALRETWRDRRADMILETRFAVISWIQHPASAALPPP